MPTIDQLNPAVASADTDLLPVSQGGVAKRVTRAQLVAGLQPDLSLLPGLLGRTSPGMGGPERVGIGSNLTLSNGVLSAGASFHVGDLPGGATPGLSDLIPISQQGTDVTVTAGALLGSLPLFPGIDLSGQVVNAGIGVTRSLAAWTSDAVPVEAFGALGDGVTDDTAAFNRALISGRPIRLDARAYVVNGQWTISQRAVFVGVPGISTMRCKAQIGGAWIAVAGASFIAIGIEFDAGNLHADCWGVLIEPGCTQTLFDTCVFANAGGPNLGNGLTIQARDGLAATPSQHTIVGCTFRNNAVHGLWVQAATGASIDGCVAYQNGSYGLCLDNNDPAFQQVARDGRVIGCRAWGNERGISVGNYNATNGEPPVWGLTNPDVLNTVIAGNVCFDNAAYGIAVSGTGLQVTGNQIETGTQHSEACGVLMNAARSVVAGNVVVGPGPYGIDAGGCADCEIVGNLVQDCGVGINCGGGQSVRVSQNRLLSNTWGVTAYQVETDGNGNNFGMACSRLRIDQNVIQIKDATGGGIYLVDAPQNVMVIGNDFEGGATSVPSQALWAHTDSVVIHGNFWNNQARYVCNPVVSDGLTQVQVPDCLDRLLLSAPGQAIGSIVGQHQIAMAGQVSFIRVTNGGQGYSRAIVSVTGTGSGAQATPYICSGSVIGVAVTSSGAGYGASGATVSIVGDGQGATAVACVGLPVLEGRRLVVQCANQTEFKRLGSVPFQDNWTGVDVTVPAGAEITWVGTWGNWQAVSSTISDYLSPGGDGSVAIRSIAGDVALRPSGAGCVRIGSDTETVGFVSTLGRGSPEGVVSAPPGSDYRNLNGGGGTTFWMKISGTGAVGWVAIA